MQWEFVVALAVPIILLPVVFVWYLNVGGILKALRAFRMRQATQR